MAFPKFHGITLAGNSWIENAHFERLASDPVPVSAGRVWFNLTEKKLKFSSLDAEGAVIIRVFASEQDLLAAFDNSKAYTDSAIATLKGASPAVLDTLQEIATALNNDPNLYSTIVSLTDTKIASLKAELLGTVSSSLDTLGEIEAAINRIDGASSIDGSFRKEIAAEAAARASGDAGLQSQVGTLTSLTTTEKSSLVGAINEVKTSVGAEATRALAAEGSLDSRISAVEAVATGNTGVLSQLTTDVKTSLVEAINETHADLLAEEAARIAADAAEVAARQAAVATVTAAVATEATRAQGAEADLQAAIDAEAAARTLRDSQLTTLVGTAQTAAVAAQTAVDAEVTARQAAVAGVAADLAAEVTARGTAVAGVAASVTTEVAARQAADAALQTAVDGEVTARQAAETALRAALNALEFTFLSPSAAQTHVINHNLNSSFLLFSVMVEGADGKFRNDIVPVEELNSGSIRIDLTEAARIKVAVRSLAGV